MIRNFQIKRNPKKVLSTQKSDPQNSSILKAYSFENFLPKNIPTDEKLA